MGGGDGTLATAAAVSLLWGLGTWHTFAAPPTQQQKQKQRHRQYHRCACHVSTGAGTRTVLLLLLLGAAQALPVVDSVASQSGVQMLPLNIELYEDMNYEPHYNPNDQHALKCVHTINDDHYDFRALAGSYVLSSPFDHSQFRIKLVQNRKEEETGEARSGERERCIEIKSGANDFVMDVQKRERCACFTPPKRIDSDCRTLSPPPPPLLFLHPTISMCVRPKECNGQTDAVVCRQKRLVREAGVEGWCWASSPLQACVHA